MIFATEGARAWPRRLLVATVSLLCVGLATEVLAQLSTGRVRARGRVESADGQPIENAEIVMTHLPTGDVVSTETDDKGVWVKGNMGPGTWRIEVSAPGYARWQRDINFRNIRRDVRVETILQPGTPADSAGGAAPASLFAGELGERILAANALFDAGDHAAALEAFESVLDEEAAKETPHPQIHFVHLNAGNTAFALKEYTQAAEHYGALLEKDPENTDARLGLAKVYMMEHKLDEAMAEIEQLDLSGVRDPIVFYNIGTLLFDEGQSAEAEGFYAEAVRLDPNFVEARMQLGLTLVQQQKMAEAKPHFEKVVELAPGTEDAAVAQQFLAMIEG